MKIVLPFSLLLASLRHTTLLAVLLSPSLAGCSSQWFVDAHSNGTTLLADGHVKATLFAGPTGTLVTIADPTPLPTDIRSASSVKVALAGVAVPLTKNTTGTYTFTLPPNLQLHQDVDGNLHVLFVLDEHTSDIVTLVVQK